MNRFLIILLLIVGCGVSPLKSLEWNIPKPVHDQGALDSFTSKWAIESLDDISDMIHHWVNGDCYEYALLGVWGLEEMGKSARLVHVGNSVTRETHAIALSNDNKYLVSEKGVEMLTWNDWQRQLLKIYYKYDEVVE